MKPLSRTPWLALLAGVLLALPVLAQTPPKPEAAQEASTGPDPKIFDDIMSCLAEGLPADWKRAWFIVSEVGRDERSATRSFEANFFYATDATDTTGKRLRTCGPQRIVENIRALNAHLPDDQQRWTGATFVFMNDGKFQVTYDYSEFKRKPAADAAPAEAKPAAKPAAKSSSKKKPEASR